MLIGYILYALLPVATLSHNSVKIFQIVCFIVLLPGYLLIDVPKARLKIYLSGLNKGLSRGCKK